MTVMVRSKNNYAFIDIQNIHLGMKRLGWQLDYRRFRVYLREKYGVSRAYIFIGFISSNQKLYLNLANAGFVLIFKQVVHNTKGMLKANVDADLVLMAMIDYRSYGRAIIVSSDGDFYSLVDYLYQNGKLETVISPDLQRCSWLLKQKAHGRIWFLSGLRGMLEYLDTKKGSA